MGFSAVYNVLQEVFPQIDPRVLRAVAIEHSKDSDVAVEVVVLEVIPYLSQQSTTPSSSNESGSSLNLSEAVADTNTTSRTNDALLADSACLDESVNGLSSYNASAGSDLVCGDHGNDDLISLEKCEESNVKVGLDMFSPVTSTTLIHENGANYDDDQACGNSESEETISWKRPESNMNGVGSDQSSCVTMAALNHGDAGSNGFMNGRLHTDLGDLNLSDQVCGNSESEETISWKCFESSTNVVGSDQGSRVKPTTLKPSDVGANGSMNGHLHADWEDLNGPADCNMNMAVRGESQEGQSRLDGKPLEVKNSVVQLASSNLQECTPNATESSLELVVVPGMLITDFSKSEANVSFDASSKKDISTSEMVDLEDDSALNTMVTRSGQICSTDLLEDIIEDERSNKKTLKTFKDLVISLMREVEVQEKAAEQAKEEAARWGLDLLSKVEDLKQMLRHAKEANDLHSGEVYGERAILATEVRELQSRLLSLSDERDKSLVILDEMRQTLEVRLAEAEKEMKAVEQEKLEKEESARKALVDQELVMEKVVQESNILQQETEENSKLREFLMDRGRVVDVLQGEISVICQDVKLLKEKFDERIPLAKSLSSSQTSCILASSISSVKSLASDQLPELADSTESPKKASATPSVDNQPSSGEDRARDDRKALVNDGWEFFDNHEFYM